MTHARIFPNPRDPLFLPPIRPGQVPIVLADCASGIFSPALHAFLSHAADPTALAKLCDAWIETLISQGADPARAMTFVAREAARVREAFPVPEQVRAA